MQLKSTEVKSKICKAGYKTCQGGLVFRLSLSKVH